MVKFLIYKFLSIFSKKQLLSPRIEYTNNGFPEVQKWAISEFIIEHVIPIIGITPYPLPEIDLLVSSVLWYRPSHICEWGTHFGKSARLFYETVKIYNLSTTIISVDLPENVDHIEHPHDQRGKYIKGMPIKLLSGDGVTTSILHLKKLSKNNIRPMFFLDGDHSYKSVKRELDIIWKAYPSAAIIIHDTFYQSSESGYNVGPYLAVKEFVSSHKNRFYMMQTYFGLPGMTVLISKYEK